ncbi:hypothetical protein HC031_22220 [Planosporangium thailandense]|uniref:Uncharacterized protein n=1 Tax=Planosporangium thailandense TaxID=765197 RepID=A0ABX0Y4S9_9ACTN|nr:hypothetical protein [Planosporangium thailandense]NJC72413.1 hypothetical protein [Planosporangium thailandense]
MRGGRFAILGALVATALTTVGAAPAALAAPVNAQALTVTTATTGFSPASPYVGQPVALTGIVTPHETGRAVTAQRLSGTTWTTIARATTTTDGAYRIALPTPTAAGVTTWRVTVAATPTRQAYTSATRTLTVQPSGPSVVITNGSQVRAVEVTGAHRSKVLLDGAIDVQTAPTGRMTYTTINWVTGGSDLYVSGAGLARRKLASSTCLLSNVIDRSGRYVAWVYAATTSNGLCRATGKIGLFEAVTGATRTITGPVGMAGRSDSFVSFTREGNHLIAYPNPGGAWDMYAYALATGRWTRLSVPGDGPIAVDVPAPAGRIAVWTFYVHKPCASGVWFVAVDGTTPATCASSKVAGRYAASPDGRLTAWAAQVKGVEHIMLGDAHLTLVRDLGPTGSTAWFPSTPSFVGNGFVTWFMLKNSQPTYVVRPVSGGSPWSPPAGWDVIGWVNHQ